jgi:glutathione S-transferase
MVLCVQVEDFKLIHIDLSNKPSWYTSRINRRGLVPSIVDGKGVSHVESLEICKWIDDEDMQGVDVYPVHERDAIDAQVCLGNAVISAGLDACSGNSRFWGIGTKVSQKQLESLAKSIDNLFDAKDSINVSAEFLAGANMTLADINLFPFITRFEAAMEQAYGIRIDTFGNGRLKHWISVMRDRPSCKLTESDPDLLKTQYARHSSLDFFDYSTYNMFSLHPHLDM